MRCFSRFKVISRIAVRDAIFCLIGGLAEAATIPRYLCGLTIDFQYDSIDGRVGVCNIQPDRIGKTSNGQGRAE